MVLPIVGLILVGFLISLPITAVLVRVGHRLGAMDTPGSAGHRKAEVHHVPNIGGIAIVAGVWIPLVIGLIVLWSISPASWQEMVPALDGWQVERIRASTPTAVALLVGMAILHVMGIIDDRTPLGPFLKLGVQVAVAAAMAIWFDVRLLTLLGPILSVLVTIIWIVAITNAINFLDNMDGLAAGVSAIAAALFMVACLLNTQWYVAATLALLIGSLLGFLIFNIPPAKIFMGDGGSLVIGFVLAVLTARTTFIHPELGGGWYAVFMPLIVLAIPLYDFLSVTLIRISQGKSPFVGDQQHFSHRLVQRGLSRRGAVVVIWSATAVTGIGGVLLGRVAGWQAILIALQTVLVLVMLALLEHASRHAVSKDVSKKADRHQNR